VTREKEADVYELVKEEILVRKRGIKAIVLVPKESTKFDHDYLVFLDELRSGYILDPRIGRAFKPLNVIVLSRKYLKDLDGREAEADCRWCYEL